MVLQRSCGTVASVVEMRLLQQIAFVVTQSNRMKFAALTLHEYRLDVASALKLGLKYSSG